MNAHRTKLVVMVARRDPRRGDGVAAASRPASRGKALFRYTGRLAAAPGRRRDLDLRLRGDRQQARAPLAARPQPDAVLRGRREDRVPARGRTACPHVVALARPARGRLGHRQRPRRRRSRASTRSRHARRDRRRPRRRARVREAAAVPVHRQAAARPPAAKSRSRSAAATGSPCASCSATRATQTFTYSDEHDLPALAGQGADRHLARASSRRRPRRRPHPRRPHLDARPARGHPGRAHRRARAAPRSTPTAALPSRRGRLAPAGPFPCALYAALLHWTHERLIWTGNHAGTDRGDTGGARDAAAQRPDGCSRRGSPRDWPVRQRCLRAPVSGPAGSSFSPAYFFGGHMVRAEVDREDRRRDPRLPARPRHRPRGHGRRRSRSRRGPATS